MTVNFDTRSVESSKLSSQSLGRPIRSLLFFALFYLYLWLEVDLRFIYHGAGIITNFPVFCRGWEFFQESLSHPGGFVEYLSAFLSQFFYYSWAGALIVAMQAWLICACTDDILIAIKALRFRWLRFIGPVLLLTMYNQYTYHFATATALLAALLFVCLYLRITPKSNLLGLIVFLVLSMTMYTIAAGAWLLFAVLCVIYELVFQRRWQMGLVYLFSAPLITYVLGGFIFGVSIIDSFSKLWPFSWEILTIFAGDSTGIAGPARMVTMVYALYLFLPLATLVLGLWRMFIGSPALPPTHNSSEAKHDSISGRRKVKKGPQSKPSKLAKGILSWYTGMPALRWSIELSVLFVVTGAAALLSHDNKLKSMFAVDYYSWHKMWPQVLEASRHNPEKYHPYILNAVCQALYHTDRLSHDLFSYPKQCNVHALVVPSPGPIYYYSTIWKSTPTYLDLGLINLAENRLIESLETFGERPMILKELALVNLARGNTCTAQVYLAALSKTLFYADWADNYLNCLQSDPNLSTDDRIRHLRELMVTEDYGYSSCNFEEFLLALLKKNNQNRMAFEYLMTHYLLSRQPDKFVQNLERLNDFDYSVIPRVYEEAILLYRFAGKKVELGGREISRESQERFSRFYSVYFGQYGGNKRAAFGKLARDYGDSYLFYYLYGRSGMKK